MRLPYPAFSFLRSSHIFAWPYSGPLQFFTNLPFQLNASPSQWHMTRICMFISIKRMLFNYCCLQRLRGVANPYFHEFLYGLSIHILNLYSERVHFIVEVAQVPKHASTRWVIIAFPSPLDAIIFRGCIKNMCVQF